MDSIILYSLFSDKEFCQKVLPYLKPNYFSTYEEQLIFKVIKKYVERFKSLPTSSIIKIAISNKTNIREETFNKVCERLDEIVNEIDEEFNLDWLIEETEKFAKDRALEHAIISSVDILKDESQNRGKIQELISKALEVSFDTTIGINFFDEEDIDSRWLEYHEDLIKYPTCIEKFNSILNGGFIRKTLTLFLGGTHSGKTRNKISIASDFIRKGKNVLYVSLEMSESEISKRFEANFLNVPINDINDIEEDKFKSSIIKLKRKNYGKLIIKEFPPACINVIHIRRLIDDLKSKKKFTPDLIVIDYLNLLTSSRISEGNSYTIVKAIAEEVRGIAVEGNYIMLSSTQTNRGGQSSSDLQMEDTSESFGLPATADLYIGIISTEELYEQGLQIWKILKNRISGIINYKLPVKVENEFCKVSDLEYDKEQELNIINNDKSSLLMEKVNRSKKKKKLKININEEEIKSEINELMN